VGTETLLQRLTSEFRYARGLIGAVRRTGAVARARDKTLGDYFERWAAAYGDKIALESESAALSYRALDAKANRIARWAKAQGWGKGDCVALFMRNRPDYVGSGPAWRAPGSPPPCSTPIFPGAPWRMA